MTMLKKFISILVMLTLAACGGGGTTGTAPFTGGTGTGGGTGGGGGGGGAATTYVVTLQLSSQTVTASAPANVSARVTTSTGTAVPNQVVTFSTAAGLGMFSASTALTNADGLATTTLSPAAAANNGADSVVATASIGGTVYTGSQGFQLTATNVSIAAFTSSLGAASLPAYGETLLTVRLNGTTPAVPVAVTITSACVSAGRATLTPASVTTSTGIATFTYRDAGCGAFNATEGLQAVVAGTTSSALSLALTAPAVSSIAFVSASPTQIYLQGSGFTENANITFQVRDASGLGVPNRNVSLEPTTLAGGLLIDGGSVPVTRVSDSNGNVVVRINAGTVPTPVRVRATLTGSSISTVSSSLAIAVGLPAQQQFSLSQATLNIEGGNTDGVTNTYTVIASDRLGNPVPQDTAINFVSEGGQVQAIRFTSVDSATGLASATASFQSSSPRPADGRVTVLAYALGEESFLDANGNNVYDAGEDYQDLGDVFLDRLFNGSYNINEDQFISLSLSGTDACRVATSALLRLNVNEPSRVLSSSGAAISSCAAGWGRAYVRKATQTVFSNSGARLGWRQIPDTRVRSVGAAGTCRRLTLTDQISTSPYAAIGDTATPVTFYTLGDSSNVALINMGKNGSFGFLVADDNNVALNPAAAGTAISATATAGLAVTVNASVVPSTLSPSSSAISYSFDDTTSSGTVTISVQSPRGLVTILTQTIYLGDPASAMPAVPTYSCP